MTTATSLIHERVLGQADAHPGQPAVINGATTLTYGRLAAGAMTVAQALQDRGAGAERVVALSGDRSAAGVIGLLGILLAGAAYVFVDPELPADRARYMLDRCDVDLIVTTRGAHPASERSRRCLDVVALLADAPRQGSPRRVAAADDLAYVVYTSGSTGTPKGVAVEHGGVRNMASELAAVLGVGRATRVLQFSSWAWDAAVAELLMPLSVGATVVLAPQAVRGGGDALARLMRESEIEVVTLTPSVLAALPAGDLPALTTVAAVGETLTPTVLRRWATGGRRVLNGYGPTEATVAVSVGECRPGEPVHVGRPIGGVRVEVVDDQRRPVPRGTSGVLLVGGPGVARGYVDGERGLPAISGGGRFFADPLGERWYDTGDRVIQRDDGTLVHLGRVDEQVQVHGHRVELAEVEATLGRDPAVHACAAYVRGGRLVADVVMALAPDGVDAVAARAGEWLPRHMVPDIRAVDRLPLTPNGKLDRERLGEAAEPGVPPSPSVPESVADRLLACVRDLLELPAAQPDDDIFELGGHSLLAAELSVAIATHIGVDLPVLTIVDHPTAAQLADVVTPLLQAAR